MSVTGFKVSTWFNLGKDCQIEYSVIGGEIEFALGPDGGDIQIVTTEEGLENLIEVTTKALASVREQPYED
ncbi:hypothetical protein [Actinokineospora sp. NBRC 105648]|uniref:hypothetical protein n=1 Tax=Actinokineospora sp. NBRC 105648 TaxID=3032206 RepID=UPI0024A27514|nr:hypothetical protein [Actinokineospora sp. NBRC 105648]GLZ37738.1 hypothetical protein Acsp05_13630 [Actinokineospora sp. NBRC 105648]